MRFRNPSPTYPSHKSSAANLPALLAWALLLVPTMTLPAQSVWNGGGADDNLTNPLNWGGVAPVPSPITDLTFSGAIRPSPFNDFAANSDFRHLVFNSGTAFNLGGANVIDLFGNVTASGASHTISAPLELQAGAHTFTTSSQLTLSGILSGPGSITKAGANHLVLTTPNTYIGGTVIGGTGRVQANTSDVFGTGTVTVNSGAQAWLNAGTHSNNFTLNGVGSSEGAGNLGAIRFGGSATLSGNVTLASDSRITAYGSAGTISGTISGPGNLNIGGGTTGSSGGNVILSGDSSSFGGNITVTRGTLTISAANALGNTTGTTTVTGADGTTAATLNLNPSTGVTIAENLIFNANSAGRAQLANAAQVNTLTGTIDVSSTGNLVQFSSNGSGGLTIQGDITGTMSGGSLLFLRGGSTNTANHIQGSLNLTGGNLAKTDAGHWIVGAPGKTYSWNGTQVAVGTLRMGAAGVLPTTTTVTMGQNDNNGATLDLNNHNQTVSGITFNYGGGAITSTGTINTGTGTLTLLGNLTYNTVNAYTGQGGVINGNLNLGGGTRTFTINDSTGSTSEFRLNATVSNGTLSKAGAGNLVLNSSTFSNLAVTAGSIAPGTMAAAGTVTTGTLALSGGTTLHFNSGDGPSDIINVTAAGGLAAASTVSFNFAPVGGFTVGNNYDLITYSGTSPGAASFAIAGTLPGRATGTIVDTGTAIALNIASIDNLIWDGSVNNDWNINSTANFTLQSTMLPATFLQGDHVVFADSPTTSTVNVATNVFPAKVTFANTGTTTYTLASTGGIQGLATLTANGGGTSILANAANSYTGATTVTNNSTLELDMDSGTLTGTSVVQVDAGSTFRITRDNAGFTFNRNLAGAGTVRVNPRSIISGTGTLEVQLTGNNIDFTGTLVLEAPLGGSARLGGVNTSRLGGASIVVENRNQLFVANSSSYANDITITGDGFIDGLGPIGALRLDGSPTWAGNVTVTGTPGTSGGTTHDARIGHNGGTARITGDITGGDLSLWVYHSTGGDIALLGNNSYGDTIIGRPDNLAGSTGGFTRVTIGDPANVNATSGTLGTGTVYMAPGLPGQAKSSWLRFQRADGYALPGNILLAPGNAGASTNIEVNTQGTGLSTNGFNINLPDGNIRVSRGMTGLPGTTTGGIFNIDNGSNITVGLFDVGSESGGTNATVNQFAGSTVTLSNRINLGHWGSNTSTYNMAGGTLTLSAAAPVSSPSAASEVAGGIYLGIDGTGVFNHSGGTVSTNFLVLDNRGNTAGTDQYNLSGSGILELRSQWGVIGRHASTDMTWSGGTIRNTAAAGTDVALNIPMAVSGPGTLDTVNASSRFSLMNNISGSGTITTTGGGIIELQPDSNATRTGVSTGTGTQTISANIAGTSPILKIGSGTSILTGANTYTSNTTVSAGTLLINNTSGSGTGSGNVTVLSGATLGGTGFLGTPSSLITANVQSGGTLAPGNSPGTLTFHANLTLDPGATFLVDILNPTTDLLVIGPGGSLTLTDAILAGTWGGSSANVFSGTYDASSMHWLIDNQGAGDITGTFANSTFAPSFSGLFGGVDPHLVSVGGQLFAAFYNSQFGNFSQAGLTGGNDFLLIAIPEPSRPLLLTITLTPLLLRRRRR